jgi:lysophospholipid acyltransferase (LPLAT)-like uncharacterized protein
MVVPHRLKWQKELVADLIYTLMRVSAATWRVRVVDRSGLLRNKTRSGAIFSCWHNRLAISMMINGRFVQKFGPGRGLAAIVSASKDGAIVARILELFGAQPARGSSSRRGGQALLELTTWAERGLDIAITPDGPRGPCYKVQEGAVALGQLTGLPLIPVGSKIHWKFCTKSWDRFQIPFPFTRIDVVMGEPIVVPRDSSDEQRASLRQELENRMVALNED